MPKKHAVVLTDEQRQALDRLANSGRASARKITRGRVLLAAADGDTDEATAAALGVSVGTAERVLDGDAEAKLTMPACSTPPDGHDHWTLDLLADRMVRLNHVAAVSRSTVSRHLKKATSSRGRRRSG